MLPRVSSLALALALSAPMASAQSLAQPTPPAPPADQQPSLEADRPHDFQEWTIRFEPAAWYASPSGSLRLSGDSASSPEIDVGDLNLDSPRLSPFGEFHIRAASRWRFTLSAFAFQAEDRGATFDAPGSLASLPVSAGDRVESSLTFASGEAVAAWRIPHELGKEFQDFRGRIELLGGTRFTHLDLDINGPAGSLSEEHFFVEPLVGAKLSMDIGERFTVDLQNTFGYFGTGDKSILSWDIFAGFMYFPTHNIGAQIGFRQYFFRLDDGADGAEGEKFEYNGALAGLYAGLSIRY